MLNPLPGLSGSQDAGWTVPQMRQISAPKYHISQWILPVAVGRPVPRDRLEHARTFGCHDEIVHLSGMPPARRSGSQE